MKRNRLLYLIGGIPAGVILFVVLTLAFVSSQTIQALLVRSAASAGYTLAFNGFAKALPFGFKAASVELSSAQGPLVKVTGAKATLRLLPLLAGKVKVGYRGTVGGGKLDGELSLGKLDGELSLGKQRGWSLEGHGIRLEEVPFFTSVARARVKGELRITGKASAAAGGLTGELQLQVRGADLAGLKVGEMPLPDASYRDVRGALRIERGRATLKSFTLDGDGIYARLKGETVLAQPAGNSPLNLTLELMPKPQFLERQKFVFLLLLKYQTSPGAYAIPIRGTLAHPVI